MIVANRSNSPKNLTKEADRGFKMPAYRKRKGYDQAIVTLTDSVTGKRRDYWLGTYGTRESRETYLRVITQWVAECRRFPDRPGEGRAAGKSATSQAEQITVAEVIAAYWAWAKDSYRRTDAGTLKVAPPAAAVVRDVAGAGVRTVEALLAPECDDQGGRAPRAC